MFLVAANTRQALVGQKEWITTGSSGIQVQFLFSDDWEGLSKFAVFRNAEIEESVIPIALPESNLTELPAENCAAEYVDEKVYVGVYGSDGLGHIIIPTIWVSLGVLKEGAAYEGMDPPQPTQDMWAQILAIAQNAGAENAAAAAQSAEEAEASKEAIQDMNVQAETLPDESPLTVTKEVDPETGAVTLIFGLTRGPKGNKGDDGYSPTITITPIQGGHRFTVTDKEHPSGQSFDVMNGAKGDKGYSPAITITPIQSGHRFTATDEDHPTGQSFDVMDGAKGDAGYSPAVTITTITGGHRVTITDEDHPTGQSFDVIDGASDAGQVTFDPTQTYQSGTVGKELSDQKNAIGKLNNAINTISGNVSNDYSVATGLYISTAANLSALTASESQRTIVVHGKPNTKYHVKKATSTIMRVGIGSSNSLPVGTHLLNYAGHTTASVDELIITTDSTNAYIYIQLYASGDTATLRSIEANVKSLVVYEELTIDDTTASVYDVYSSQKTTEEIDARIAEAMEPVVEIGIGKNLYNPAATESGRLYANQAGSKQTYTTSTTERIVKMPASATQSYALSGVGVYSFVDADNTLLIPTTALDSTKMAVVVAPANTAYLWIQTNNDLYNTATQVEIGSKVSAYEPYRDKASYIYKGVKVMDSKDVPSIFNMDESSVVNPQMTKIEFCAACNAKWSDYAAFNKIHTTSFYVFPTPASETAIELDFIYKTLNHNFRETVATSDMSYEMVCNNVNKAFSKRIFRFCDAKPFTENARDFSLTTGFQADEPSAIVSDDGSTLYIYAHLKRIHTTDGMNWSEPENIVLSDNQYALHIGVNKIDGVYYLIGARLNAGGDLVLYTSSDGLNFTYQGVLFEEGYEFSSGIAVDNWGNSYLIKDYGTGKFVLFIETQKTGTPWCINVAKCDDILHQNVDGTIGDWVNSANNPVINRPYTGYTRNSNTAGNPDFFKNADGQPIRFEGKYYMYFHSTLAYYSNIVRAYSYDLENWVIEGPVVDNRDAPSAGDDHAGNADHCMVEFKGKSYFFYTWDINNPQANPYIKYTVDDRSATELLAIVP